MMIVKRRTERNPGYAKRGGKRMEGEERNDGQKG